MSDERPIIVSFGGGTNSTAMLCGFRERGIVPAAIFFADTGGEMPHTYEHLEEMREITKAWWGVEIMTVRKLYKGEPETLEAQCLRTKHLPSLAYGHKQCSVHFKGRPQDQAQKQWMREHAIAVATKAVGFGADEPWRIKPAYDVVELGGGASYRSWYPLVDWGWRRADCIAAIVRHGVTKPGKSACFFCPSANRHRVLALRDSHPALFDRGVAIEVAAQSGRKAKDGTDGVTGLHFGVKWTEMAEADDAQGKLFDWVGEHASPPTPCGCVDH